MMTSRHYNMDRVEREKLIKTIGIGEEVVTFRVDRHHINGAELHTITTNGIIIIRNERTNKLVTKLIARPNQIKRYFEDDEIDERIEKIIEIAFEHMKKGYNKR